MVFYLLILGIVIGLVGGYAGIGGAPFMVAVLVLLLGFSQFESQAIVLTMMLGPMSLLGLFSLRKEVATQIQSIVIGFLSYAFFSYFGARLAFSIAEVDLKIYFAVLLVLVSILQLLPKKLFSKNPEEEVKKIPSAWMFIIGSLTGLIGGLFGIGAGVLMIPLFMIIFKQEKNHARALSLAILLPPVSLGAFLKYNAEGVVNLKYSLILFVAYFFANYFGAKLGNNSKPIYFKIVYASLLVLISLFYFF